MALGHAVYDPETVELMGRTLEHAWGQLTGVVQTSASKTLLAERILTAAALGQRDPVRLQSCALRGLTDVIDEAMRNNAFDNLPECDAPPTSPGDAASR
jgi:hypothetical protein